MISTPIFNGKAQSDLDMAGFNLLNFSGGGGGGSIGTVLGERVSVKDAPYNATGNGTTDDTAAIQAAINAVCTAGGGTVFFPHGIYLCNGAFDATFHSILKIPIINNATTSAITLQLLGENSPAWSVVGFAQNQAFNSTIKTTRTDGMTADTSGFAAILAGQQPFGNPRHATFADYNGTMVIIRNMQFVCPDNPTMGGIRLDGVGWAQVDNTAANTFGGTQPTHGTTGIWMPNCINWSMSYLNLTNSGGFDTGFKISEHTHAVWIQAWGCLTGVAILESMYPLRGVIQFGNCVDAIKFLGPATVDFLMETEHAPSGWQSAAHDISDHSNYGSGSIQCYVGSGFPPASTYPAVDGGSGLQIIDMFSRSIALPATGSFNGRVAASSLTVGFTDTGLARNAASVLEVNNGVAGTFRELLARSVKLNAVTVATLPTSPSIGQVASVSDGGTALAWGATVTGGGSTKYLVWWNGANWTVVGK